MNTARTPSHHIAFSSQFKINNREMPQQKLTLMNGRITRQRSELRLWNRPAGSESPTAGFGAHGQCFSLDTKPGLPVAKRFGICECYFFVMTPGGGEIQQLPQTLLCVSRTQPFQHTSPELSSCCHSHGFESKQKCKFPRHVLPPTMYSFCYSLRTPVRYFILC